MWTLSCSVWDLVPRAGIEPGPPALGAWSLSYWTTREVPTHLFARPSLTSHCKILTSPWDKWLETHGVQRHSHKQ